MFFCLGSLFVWRQVCWVFNILCLFLKGWESKTARNSVLLHAECGPSQCSKLICTERICYLKKAFQKIHKGLEIHKKVVLVCFRRKKRHQRASGVDDVTICKPQSVWCSGLRLCQRIFYGLQTARGWSGTPRCSSRFRWADFREGKQPTRETNPGSETQCSWSWTVLLTAIFFLQRLSKTNISKYHPKKYQQQLSSTNII